MVNYGYRYSRQFENNIVGVEVRGTIGNLKPDTKGTSKETWVYQVTYGHQRKLKYYTPYNPNSTLQQKYRDLIRKATWSWQAEPEAVKNTYRNNEPYQPIMSGFNFYVRQYINTYK